MEKTPSFAELEALENGQSGTDLTYHKQPNLQVALDLAGAGFAVFPCRPAQEGDLKPKTPRVKEWPTVATRDLDQIRAWWGKWPDSIAGLPTGSRNGLAVLDLDRKHGKDGVAALRALGFDPDKLSPLTVETPSDGLHLYFAWPEGLGNAGNLAKLGIDIRGQGGYVIAPGAVGDLGAYVARGGATLGQGLPEWPAALLQPRAAPRPVDVSDLFGSDDADEMTAADLKALREPDWPLIRSALRAIDATERDTWFRIGAALHDESGGSDEGFKWWCKWSQRCPEKYSERAQATAWRSFKRRDGELISIATLFQIAAESGWSRPVEALPAVAPSRLSFLTPAECDAAPSRGYLIKGLLAPRDVGCIFGAPGAGKSLLAPFLGYALARGVEAFGMRTKAGPVFYVAAEDSHGMRGRVKALRQRHGDAPDFTLVDGVSDLLRADSPDLAALWDAVKARKPALIFLDTLAMAFPGLEENSAEAMGRVVKVARDLTEWGAAVVLIHHDTKAEGSTPRGHSLLNGALDMALHVKQEGGSIKGTLTKNRNGTCARDLTFTITTEEGGQDEDGDLITLPLCEPSVDLFDDALSYKERAALEPLIAMQRAEAAFSDDSEEMGCGRSSITVDEWRDLCKADKRICATDNSNSQARAFRRVKEDLFSKGLVRLVRDGTEVELCDASALAPWS